MYYIRPCPSCGQKVRFPIDKGKIKVTCSCGHSFIADPDDPSLFREGIFDLGGGNKKKRTSMQSIFARVRIPDLQAIKSRVISSLYDFRYSVQNFRLLPDVEKKRLIMKILLFIIVIIFLVYMFLYCSAPASVDGNVI